MFEVKEQYCVTTSEKLLYNIWQTLEVIKAGSTVSPAREGIADYSTMKRQQLMALVKELPEKPERWTRMKNDDLISLLKKAGEK